MNKYSFLFMVCIVLQATAAQAAEQVDRFSATVTKQVGGHYLVVKPKDYSADKKYPLLIFLHGSGERGDDIERVKIHGPFKKAEELGLDLIIVAPQSPSDHRWDVDMLGAMVDEVVEKFPIDKTRIYLTGLSMGGEGAWRLAVHRPKTFAAVAPVCGVGVPSLAENIRDIPIWVFHGAKDRTVPLRYSTAMVDALKAVDGNVRLTVYPEVGHASWDPAYSDPEFYEWLMSQSLKE